MKINFKKFMVVGVTGVHGEVAPRLVEQEQEADPEHVTIQLQLMVEKAVMDQIMRQNIVINTNAQVFL